MKLCISLDLPSADENLELVKKVKDYDVWLKVFFRRDKRDKSKF
jgi:orotidine-5'-phosphate decarboxylase